ncbi:MAG: stage V sporulation protein AD [Bacillota bacterium]
MAEKLQGQTVNFHNPPQIVSHGSVVGPEEGKGPLGRCFDLVCQDPKCGQESWEKGERRMVEQAIELVLGKAGFSINELNLIIGGDLLDQIVISNLVARNYDLPFLGLYGACSTMIEALALGSICLDGGFADNILAFTSSHYQTAERQFRTPLEYGAQYPPSKQWTVTGAGAYILATAGGQVWITHATLGKVIDLGQTDSNDMGSAMAPAAADTIIQHFLDLNRGPRDYDLIITGDLGDVGKNMLNRLLAEHEIKPGNKLKDCGGMILDDSKRYGAGGSGCASVAVVLGSYVLPEIVKGHWHRVLVLGNGALMSPISLQQQETIPAIAHALVLEKIPGGEQSG